jgi:hypothetical protein
MKRQGADSSVKRCSVAPSRAVLCASFACVLAVLAIAPCAGAATCPNEAIREARHQTLLPDCRAWEMVSPPQKNGADLTADSSRYPVASDGNAVDFSSLGGFGDVQGTGIAIDYMAQRGGTSWSTHAITPPQESLQFHAAAAEIETQYQAFSPDLATGLIQAWSPLTEDPSVADAVNLYVRPATARCVTKPRPRCPLCRLCRGVAGPLPARPTDRFWPVPRRTSATCCSSRSSNAPPTPRPSILKQAPASPSCCMNQTTARCATSASSRRARRPNAALAVRPA